MGWSVVALVTLVHLSTKLGRIVCPNGGFDLDTIKKNQDTQIVESLLSTFVGGALFEGTVIRSFEQRRFFGDSNNTLLQLQLQLEQPFKNSRCSQWSIVTTIFEPSTAVQRAAALSSTQGDGDGGPWCLVIVADTETPTDYVEKAGFLSNNQLQENVHFLSIQDQEKMITTDNDIGRFIQAIPYGHFARKNIGYLYAIQRGATLIFDFDDDNVLNLDSAGKVISPLPPLDVARVAMVGNKLAFNHHPLMGASFGKESWARGFPLSLIQDNATHGMVAYDNETLTTKISQLAVLHICADGDPDVDAIHRLVTPLPMNFQFQDTTTVTPLIVPSHTFAPYNAQATIHTQQAHWALLLPFTVPGRVSDIWRSYFAQAIFRHLNLQIAFVPPRITQFRNPHNYLADARAEFDLYFKTEKLLEFLQEWQCTTPQRSHYPNVPFCMEQLWVQLYQRQYIEINDVLLVQLWLKALVEGGYQFPTIHPDRRHRHDDIVVMGQFNFNSALPDVLFWNQKWRQWVNRLQVRGPFTQTQLEQMGAHGIEAHKGLDDKGWVSPMENLMRTCQQYQGKEGITGILYVHDDTIVNFPKLFPYGDSARGQHVLASFDIRDPRNPRGADHTESIEHSSYKILEDGVTFAKASGFQTDNWEALVANLNSRGEWGWEHKCVPAYLEVAKDPRSKLYREPDGSFLVTGHGQSDFFYVPMQHADAFVEATPLLTDNNVVLECGFPKLMDILRHGPSKATIVEVPLCTSWNRTTSTRGKIQMIEECARSSESYLVYHPIKIGVNGYKAWGSAFDIVQNL